MTEIYRLSGMKSFGDDLIARMKTGWGRFVLASELGPPTHLSRERVCPPQNQKGGGGWLHIRLRVMGWGNPNSDDWRKNLAHCILFVAIPLPYPAPCTLLAYIDKASTCHTGRTT